MIRLANPSELEEIITNLIQANSDTFGAEEIVESKKSIAELIDQGKYYVQIDGKVVGGAGFSERGDTSGVFVLNWIAVNPDYKNKGVGKYLYQVVEQRVKDSGAKMIILNAGSGEDNRFFYTKMGLKEVGRIPQYYNENKDLIWYQKML
jgi:N-acetylglutamate synthase-like GNAT family acetyltransferase